MVHYAGTGMCAVRGKMRGKGGAAMLRRIRELFNDVFRQADLVLLALCIGTSLFGILMIASATRYMHTSKLVLVQAAARRDCCSTLCGTWTCWIPT